MPRHPERIATPGATAVITGNLTNSVLSLMDLVARGRGLPSAEADRFKHSLRRLVGFPLAVLSWPLRVAMLRDWAWSVPVVLPAAE